MCSQDHPHCGRTTSVGCQTLLPPSCALQTYPTAAYSTFPEAMAAFLDESGGTGPVPAAAALAVAGAVSDNRCDMTNVNWTVDGAELQQRFRLR